MNRSHTTSYVEYALLAAALLTGSLLTTLTPASRLDAATTPSARTMVSSPATLDVIGYDVDVRRLNLVASFC